MNLGCAIINHSKDIITNKSKKESGNEIQGNLGEFNISLNNFFISKAEIEIVTPDKSEKLLGSFKFVLPGKYLISLRTRSGMEVVRVLLTNDTLLLNDRINKKLYYGSPLYLKRMYGFTPALLPLIFGDFLSDNGNDTLKLKCVEGIADIKGYVKGSKISYIFNCRKRKSIGAFIENSLDQKEVEIAYEKFVENPDYLIPQDIKISELKSKFKIEILIKKIESKWTGDIEFIPGSGYEKLPLK